MGEHSSKTYAVRSGEKIIAYFRASIENKVVLLHEITETNEDRIHKDSSVPSETRRRERGI